MAPRLAYIRAQLAKLGPVNMSDIPLVVFTPSGKRGHFPIGTPVLTAALRKDNLNLVLKIEGLQR